MKYLIVIILLVQNFKTSLEFSLTFSYILFTAFENYDFKLLLYKLMWRNVMSFFIDLVYILINVSSIVFCTFYYHNTIKTCKQSLE